MKAATFVTRCLVSNLIGSLLAAVAAETRTLDFESPATGLQAPGVAFEWPVEVIKGEVGSSAGVRLHTAPTGTNAAFSSGARIRFSLPVIKVSMLVSPSSISVQLRRTNVYYTARLHAYGATGELLATTTAPVFGGVAEPELLANFNPTLISVATPVPMAQVTIDLDEPFGIGGATFFFDDLTLTVQEQQPLVPPTMRIEPLGSVAVLVWWSIPSAQLEQSPDLVTPTWQPVPTVSGYVQIRTTNSAMFFRVVR